MLWMAQKPIGAGGSPTIIRKHATSAKSDVNQRLVANSRRYDDGLAISSPFIQRSLFDFTALICAQYLQRDEEDNANARRDS